MIANQEGFPDFDAMISVAPDGPIIPDQNASADLIPIDHESGKLSVNARDLHDFLENGDHFSTWIKERIQQFGFIEGTDFQSYSAPAEKPTGGRPSKEYALSLDMAKELSMVERNENGRRARQYFIACENKLKEQSQINLEDPAVMRSLLLGYTEKVLSLEASVSSLTPKADALDRLAEADGLMNITNAAKILQVQPKALFGCLACNGWIYRRNGSSEYVPYQAKIQQGLMVAKAHTITNQVTGEQVIKERALITAKGLTALAKEFSSPNRTR
jgi:anti-repressor protein